MKALFLKYERGFSLGFSTLSLASFLVSMFYFVCIAAPGNGDEGLFINDLIFIKSHSWIEAIEKNISIPYMLLAYPFSFFFEEYMALRLANVFLLIVLLFYFYKIAKIQTSIFYGYLAYYLATVPYFFVGTNDVLFFTGLVFFMNEIFTYLENKKMNNQILALSGLVVSFFTRELILVYLPVIILSIYFVHKNGFSFLNKNLIFPALLFCVFLIFNIPCLTNNGKLSYDEKIPSTSVNATWSQRQYLAQLWVNEGKLKNFSHPSWEQTDLYLAENGTNSLPNGILKGLTFDYALTIKEFFKDFYYSLLFGFRQLGLILLFPFYFVIRNLKDASFLSTKFYLPYALIITVSVFSLIIISFIEPRWYISIFMLVIVFYNKYQSSKEIDVGVIVANYIILTIFSVYGIYNLLHNFIGII